MTLRRHVVSFGICLLASCATLAAHGASYPSKPVKIIVQVPAEMARTWSCGSLPIVSAASGSSNR